MPRAANPERVKIWNAFFCRAWDDACIIADSQGKKPSRKLRPKLILTADEAASLHLLVACTLAIEARSSHLIDELVEKRRIGDEEAERLQRLSVDAKWFLLPQLWGRRKRLRRDKAPHQAIAEVCALRNDLFHVNFAKLRARLPNNGKMLSLFVGVVAAVEDLNVVLGRTRRPRRNVLDTARFV